MERYCGSTFWNARTTWNTNDPDFTPCFESTVFLWSACGFLWLTAFIEICFNAGELRGTAALDVPTWKPGWTKLGVFKLSNITALIALEVAMLCTNWLEHDSVNIFSIPPVLWATPLILITTHLLSATLIVRHKSNCVHTSGIQLIHWSLLSVVHIAILQTTLRAFDKHDVSKLVLLGISTVFMILQAISFCWSDIPEDKEEQVANKTKIKYGDGVQKRPECPVSKSSCLSYILYSWSTSLVSKGYKSPLQKDDLWDLQPSFQVRPVMKVFDAKFGKPKFGQVRGVFANLLKPILKTCGYSFVIAVTCRLIASLVSFNAPLLMRHLIEFVENGNIEVWKGWMWTVLLFVNYIISTLFQEQFYLHICRCYANVMICLNVKIYRKAMCISYEARTATTTGEIVNLMSVDVEKFCECLYMADSIWTTPILLTVGVYLLWLELGVAIFAGLAVLVAIIPINWILTAFSANYQRLQMKKKDDRIKIINEILSGIQVIKLYAWENSFKAEVQKIRSEELKILKKRAFFQCFIALVFNSVPFLVSLAGFLTFVTVSDDVLDPKKAFTAMSLFSLLTDPISEFPSFIASAVDATISLKRINKFLNTEELNPNATKFEGKRKGQPAIEILNGNFSWECDDPCLTDINLSIESETLTAIVGTVASGKSSLLSAILGDMKYSGECTVRGTVAYVPQVAWILNGTLRENICFGLPYDKAKYDKVIQACSLAPDIEMLPAGDMTEIGEKGINLSGGQKQRVSLARAGYSGADVYLLDDCLSAVDAHVGKYIFDQLIGPDGLFANKTRILCTHAHNFLSQVNRIVVMSEGRIVETGSFEDLRTDGGTFSTFLGKGAQSKRGSKGASTNQQGPKFESKMEEEKEKTAGKMIVEEHLETGHVKLVLFKTYIRAMGVYLAVAMILFFATSQGMEIGRNIALTKWTSSSRISHTTPYIYVYQYTALGIGQALNYLLGYLLLTVTTMSAANKLHNTMLSRILRAPMAFFNVTLLGRIVNRFSSDVESVDKQLPNYIGDWMSHVCQLLGILIVISYTNIYFVVFIIPIFIIYYLLQKYYIACMQQLQRIMSSLKSPIFAQFSETLNGTATIRAYRSQERFSGLLADKMDDFNRSLFPHLVVRRWLSIRLGFVGSAIIFFPALSAVVWRKTIDPSLVGLSISYALQFTEVLSWLIKVTSYLQYNFVSVERISQYSCIEQEAELESAYKPASPDWPKEGAIEFINYETCYRSGLDPVLKNLSCKINPGEKIGVCGRTGAGKSSLTLALFRIIEATRGEIFIDNENIASMGLHDVRKRLTVIPQDPVLFSRSLRLNLDPFGEYRDDQLWQALDLAHLKPYIETIPDGLDHSIAEGGENLSVGQRQLVCLARAILKKSSILILDEATASVDRKTDELIQETIRSTFLGCTILNVAHRLNTVLDSSRILVMDRGEIVEFDTPSALLSNPKSHFYRMAKDAGIV